MHPEAPWSNFLHYWFIDSKIRNVPLIGLDAVYWIMLHRLYVLGLREGRFDE